MPRLRSTRVRQQPYPDEGYALTAAYYSVRGNLDGRLIINNKGGREMHPRLTLYGRDGRRYTVNDIPVGPRTFVEVDLRPIVAAAGEGFDDGSIRVSYTGQKMEMGGQVRMTDLAQGIGFDEQLAYPSASHSNRLEGVWWLPSSTAVARLVVTNTSGRDVNVQVRFHQVGPPRTESLHLGPWQLQVLDLGQTGGSAPRSPAARLGGISIEHDGAPGAVAAHGLVGDRPSRFSTTVVFVDPAAAQTSTLHGAGVRLTAGATRLRPVLVARNLAPLPSRLAGRFQVAGPDGKTIAVGLPGITLAPGETRAIDVRAAWREANGLTTNPVGVELEYSSAPGTVLISAATVSGDLDQVFRVPLLDPAIEPSAAGGYYWQLDETQSAVAFIKNLTDEPRRYNLLIRFEGGTWAPGLSVVPPHQTVTIDVGAIRAEGRPDAKGRRIPGTAVFGQIHWSLVGGKARRALIGRAEQLDLVHGVSNTSACPMPVEDNYVESWIDPDYQEITNGSYADYEAWEQDEDALGHQLEDPYEITDILEWQVTSSVAASVGAGSFKGLREGATGVHAFGESNGWEDYQGEGQPGDHVWISHYADLSVFQIFPVNFQRDASYTAGLNSNNPPRLQFRYTWTWSAGGANQLQLAPCRICEDISYSPSTWPNPPYQGNPIITACPSAWDAVSLSLLDTHSTAMPFTTLPASPPNPNSYPVTGTQNYKYTCDNGNTQTDITGADHGPHTITRNVFLKPPFFNDWRFEVSKHGITKGCDLNPTTKNCQ